MKHLISSLNCHQLTCSLTNRGFHPSSPTFCVVWGLKGLMISYQKEKSSSPLPIKWGIMPVQLEETLGMLFVSSICGVGVHIHLNNFSSKTTRPRDMLLFLKDALSIENEKLFKACRSVHLFASAITSVVPHQKCENFNTLSQFSH